MAASGWARAGNIATVLAAVFAVAIAALVAVMPYARRPKLSLVEDTDKTHSHVETTPEGRIPYLRILASNENHRRAAQNTRVLVEGYRRNAAGGPFTTLGHPSLAWPSAPEADATAALTVFAGGPRPIGFGRLIRVRIDDNGKLMRPSGGIGAIVRGWPHFKDDSEGDPPAVGWYLWLDLAFAQSLHDDRDKLPPVESGYIIRLLIGADDGAARKFDVHINWDGDPKLNADEVLASALDHLAVLPT